MMAYTQLQASSPALGSDTRRNYYEQLFNLDKIATRNALEVEESKNIKDNIDNSIQNISYLSTDNIAYLEGHTFKQWNNMFVQDVESLNLTALERELPALNIAGYPNSGHKNATTTERILYDLFTSGVVQMEGTSYMQAVFRFEKSMQESADSRS